MTMSTIAKLTLDQYNRMIAAGIFDRDQRVELILGELRDMTSLGPFHESAVDILTRWSTNVTPEDKVRIRIQNSIGIPELDSAPQPDVVWVVERDYFKGRPNPDDVLLVIEVSDSSLGTDRFDKAELYAEADIKDYWIVNVQERCVEVFRDPHKERYRTMKTLQPDESISPLAMADAILRLSRLFPS
jgi:Uma2 family endonuclease